MRAKVSLAQMLAAASVIYGSGFDPVILLKAISYFEDPQLADLPDSLRRDLVAAVRGVDLAKLPLLAAVRNREA